MSKISEMTVQLMESGKLLKSRYAEGTEQAKLHDYSLRDKFTSEQITEYATLAVRQKFRDKEHVELNGRGASSIETDLHISGTRTTDVLAGLATLPKVEMAIDEILTRHMGKRSQRKPTSSSVEQDKSHVHLTAEIFQDALKDAFSNFYVEAFLGSDPGDLATAIDKTPSIIPQFLSHFAKYRDPSGRNAAALRKLLDASPHPETGEQLSLRESIGSFINEPVNNSPQLHRAAWYGNEIALEMFLELGANLEIKNTYKHEQTVFDIIKERRSFLEEVKPGMVQEMKQIISRYRELSGVRQQCRIYSMPKSQAKLGQEDLGPRLRGFLDICTLEVLATILAVHDSRARFIEGLYYLLYYAVEHKLCSNVTLLLESDKLTSVASHLLSLPWPALQELIAAKLTEVPLRSQIYNDLVVAKNAITSFRKLTLASTQ
jgi:hypothetical protein